MGKWCWYFIGASIYLSLQEATDGSGYLTIFFYSSIIQLLVIN